jgi:hypothetical protein
MARIVAAALVLLTLFTAGPIFAQEDEVSTSGAPSPSRPGRHALGVNSPGDGFDPSDNVKALSEAANKRQDDLRLADEKLTKALLDAQEKINAFRAEQAKELSAAQDRRIDENSKLRAEYNEHLAVAEAKRIDAIRAVDVNAVAVASTRATDQAQVLATQVSQSAEALRTLVATTASTVAASQQQLANTLSARLTTLEQAGYQQAGKQTFQDPAFVALVAEVKTLAAARTETVGSAAGRGDVIGWIVAGIVLLMTMVTLALNIMRNQREGRTRTG